MPARLTNSVVATALALAASGCLTTPDPSPSTDGGEGVADASIRDGSPAIGDAPMSDAGATRVDKIAVGWEHTCALFDNGRVKCWGEGSYGRLGYADHFGYDGDTQPNDVGDDESVAGAPFVDVGGTAIDITAGTYHTCVVLMGGAVRCWGRNTAGQLGYAADWGNTPEAEYIGDDETPASAGDVLVGAPVQRVIAGALHTCVLLADDTTRCWGQQTFGKLGYPGQSEPVGDDEFPSVLSAIDVGNTVLQIDAHNEHTCAVLSDHTVRCWGRGRHGRLGYSDTHGTEMNGEPEHIGDDETPASAGAPMLGDTAVAIDVGYDHTCAILTTNSDVRCWGSGAFSKLGQTSDDIGDDEHPSTSPVLSLGGAAVELSLGEYHSCARLADMTVRCWGNGGEGRLGYGDELEVGNNETPAQRGPVPVGGDVQQIATTSVHTCALLTSGTVRCWGDGANGRLGYGDTENIGDTETPEDTGDVPLLP